MKNDYTAIVKETLQIEANTLLDAAENISQDLEKIVEVIRHCKGKLIVTGVGKSGLIGAKMAATFASTGTPSFFLHPTEAMHGDLGMIGKDDVVLAISYSGESAELSSILPHVKRFDIPLIGMTKNNQSTLGRYSDLLIRIDVKREACPLDIAPTSSTTLTLALGDALAVCLMKARDFKKEDFASFHPGGTLGRQLFVKVSDLMRTKNLPVIGMQTPVKEAIVTISEGRLGTVLLVDDDGKFAGLISDGDIRRALMDERFSLEQPASSFATLNPKTIDDPSMLASDALVLVEKYKIQLLVVLDSERKILGVLHLHDLVEKGIA
ncbi:KpsF/GutQ family sugar-phosphate isomerase [Sulfurimonas sp. HSL3-7]|uniref:KpsF/GutQ family sugar-phosphate isomerase n=1 Tax=Sulfonitrofixus jiaomeiensis TaxID=3131938 RepID=UPI0031FA15CE